MYLQYSVTDCYQAHRKIVVVVEGSVNIIQHRL